MQELKTENVNRKGHFLIDPELLEHILQNQNCYNYLARLPSSNKGRMRKNFVDNLDTFLKFLTTPANLLESVRKVIRSQTSFLNSSSGYALATFPSFREFQYKHKHEEELECVKSFT